MHDTGFPYSSNPDAKVLILGSMPGKKSLLEDQYYAHPQNVFWPIMGQLFEFEEKMDYEKRLLCLGENGVALWDVAYQCVRPGSLDSAIKMESVVANNFEHFFSDHPDIHAIFFNGRKAEELYRRLVQKNLPPAFQQIKSHLLPSTSPANAGMNRTQKLDHWKIVRQTLEIG
ncbi:uracil DNA glycosylase superfamily protein [Mariprofundus micogutta]|uniref:Uracil DNA glycosylase superfamily protein n=1 Tax=Mariprofundus micogutta TaxID=1921010 RepID=A0A1L8CKT4_9PROT|nr:DNA-deoxyinosine glycosylase [Mariprofundus micogutta]GAV19517.1 uracil DNA glycosylase superfamily protein [Mariprofundus micogutta]